MRLFSFCFAGLLAACGGGASEGTPSSTPLGGAGMATAGSSAGSSTTTSGAGGAAIAGATSDGGSVNEPTDGGTGNGGGGAGGTSATAGGSAGSAGSGGHAAPDPALPPGQNYDLSHFALQLPIAEGNSVLQIKDPALITYTSDYFFTGTDAAMVFWCPVTGAHTPNTHYPRSELRELPEGGDWAITGHHRLTASFKMLQNTPSKGTIVGQIHGNSTGGTSEVLKLEWMSNNDIVASVEQNDSPSSQVDHKMGSGYKHDELVSYDFELKDATLTVKVTDARGTASFTTPYTAASWTQDKYYFKLGAYVQLDTGGSSVGGKVAFYSFAIEHD